jgi:hypothetical protein
MTESEEKELVRRLTAMSDEELIEFEENLMDIIIEKKMSQNLITFSGVENGLLN